jgi:hypothetical protein
MYKDRHSGMPWFCDCITCHSVRHGAIDLRPGQHLLNNFKKRPCKLCQKIRSKEELSRDDEYYGWIKKSLYVPDVVKEFLEMEYICERCLGQIDHRMIKLRACWGTAHPAVIKLAIVMLLKNEFSAVAWHDNWQKMTITKAIKNKENISDWSWATQDKIDDALRRIAKHTI